MNGNISKDGIAADLAWMKRAGLAGVQTFDIEREVPTIVPKRVLYMSPEWKDAFRYATGLAADLDFEVTIASSPGWSLTGGPWVKPQDGMKKLTWSETVVNGGRRFVGMLPPPAATTGPFMDVAAREHGAISEERPSHYDDAAVFAYRIARPPASAAPTVTLGDGKAIDAGALSDGKFATGVKVPRGTAEAPAFLNLGYAHPQTVRSLTLHMPGNADMFSGAGIAATLEADRGAGAWSKVADLAISAAPTTASFAPVTATRFRLVVRPRIPDLNESTGLPAAPGYAGFVVTPAMMVGRGPLEVTELHLSPEAKIDHFETKAGFSITQDYHALPDPADATSTGVPPTAVVDLTGRMRADGTLDWQAPKGTWRVVRLGYALTGKTNAPAPPEATGLEVDKLDAAAVRSYVESYLRTYREVVGPELIGARGIRALLTDSTEVGAFNWTPGMIEEFRRLRGYDPRPWLPALTGAIVGSRSQSDRFLYDFRTTLGDLHASAHYGTLTQVAHENGLKVYSEALEGWRVALGDDIEMRRHADFPMAALWSYPRDGSPRPGYFSDMRGAASAAHLYGQNIVAAESMTSSRFPFADAPSDLRRVVDLEFANGINRLAIHTSVHQPTEQAPGMSMGNIGQFFTRHETWAEMARPWIDYVARSSFLLQQGRFHADVAWFYGEEAPLAPLGATNRLSGLPTRYAYDFVSPGALRDLLKVDSGELVAPSGARYRVLYLGGTSERMTLPTLRRIAGLAEAGATIVGLPPSASAALTDDPREFRELVGKLWSGGLVTRVGQGRIIADTNAESALRSISIDPDFDYVKPADDSEVLFVHRKLADGDIYFVNNRRNRPERIEARFRVAGKAPELWRADTGGNAPVSYRVEGNRTVVPLTLGAEESLFVVFRRPTSTGEVILPDPAAAPSAGIAGPWKVAFQTGRGAPATASLATLKPLNEHAVPGIRFFSGVATYTTSFELPSGYRTGQPLLLDLGQVGDLAEVRVNGKPVGTAWHAPFQVPVGSAVRPGKNTLEVRVANLWVNRLIGDQQPGATKIAWTAMPTYKADAPLRSAGLIGPVTLLADKGP